MNIHAKCLPVYIKVIILILCQNISSISQDSTIEFREADLELSHISGQILSYSNLKSSNLFGSVQSLTNNKSSIWYKSIITNKNNEYLDKNVKLISNKSLDLLISEDNKIESIEIRDDAYKLVFQEIEFAVNDSLSTLIRQLQIKNIAFTKDITYNFLNLPFMYENLIKGASKIVAGSRSLLIYYDPTDNCIDALRITEWD